MPFRVREEVLNVVLAELLQARGLLSIPETIRATLASPNRRLPDITVGDLSGLRIVIEGRLARGGAVRTSLLRDARARVQEGIAPLCLAVLYPAGLEHVNSLATLRRNIGRATLSVRVISEQGDGQWSDATVDSVAEILRNSYDIIIGEDVVTESVEDLSASIEAATESIAETTTNPHRLRQLLGIPTHVDDDEDEEE